MKRLLATLFSLAAMNVIIADEHPTRVEEPNPNTALTVSFNDFEKAKFSKTRSQRGHHFKFSQGYVLGNYVQTLANKKTDIEYGVGYMKSKFKFSHQHHMTSFKQQNFNNLLLQMGANMRQVQDWKVNVGLGAQLNTEHLTSARYTLFSGVIHGIYDLQEKTHLHVGLTGYSGLRYTRVLPVLGFDYAFSEKLLLNAVFPLNMSLVYAFNKEFAVDAAIRFMTSRQRLNKNNENSRGLVTYRNWGGEIGLNYTPNEHFRINLHVGETFGTRMRISNRKDHDRKHLRLDSALYYGLDATIAF